MVRNNYNKLDKVTFVAWVGKAVDVDLSRRNIESGFQVTRIYPFNSKAMDGRTKCSELYIVDRNNDTLNEDNVENSYEIMNDI
jgi:hypothetical protein